MPRSERPLSPASSPARRASSPVEQLATRAVALAIPNVAWWMPAPCAPGFAWMDVRDCSNYSGYFLYKNQRFDKLDRNNIPDSEKSRRIVAVQNRWWLLQLGALGGLLVAAIVATVCSHLLIWGTIVPVLLLPWCGFSAVTMWSTFDTLFPPLWQLNNTHLGLVLANRQDPGQADALQAKVPQYDWLDTDWRIVQKGFSAHLSQCILGWPAALIGGAAFGVWCMAGGYWGLGFACVTLIELVVAMAVGLKLANGLFVLLKEPISRCLEYLRIGLEKVQDAVHGLYRSCTQQHARP